MLGGLLEATATAVAAGREISEAWSSDMKQVSHQVSEHFRNDARVGWQEGMLTVRQVSAEATHDLDNSLKGAATLLANAGSDVVREQSREWQKMVADVTASARDDLDDLKLFLRKFVEDAPAKLEAVMCDWFSKLVAVAVALILLIGLVFGQLGVAMMWWGITPLPCLLAVGTYMLYEQQRSLQLDRITLGALQRIKRIIKMR